MSRAAISIFVFGCYLVLNAMVLAFAPNLMLSVLGLPPTNEPWLRVLGIVVFVLGLYYIQAARQEVTPFFRWTTWARPIVLGAFIAFVAAGIMPAVLIGFGVVDAAGAIWTALALRSRAA